MKIRSEPQDSYFNTNLRRRKTGEMETYGD